MTRYVVLEEETKPGDEERASGDSAGLGKPKRGSNRVYSVPGVKIPREVNEWAEVEAMSRNYNPVSLEKPVSLVAGQEEVIKFMLNVDCVASGHLFPVLEGCIIWKY